jgi:hypothetical protein
MTFWAPGRDATFFGPAADSLRMFVIESKTPTRAVHRATARTIGDARALAA